VIAALQQTPPSTPRPPPTSTPVRTCASRAESQGVNAAFQASVLKISGGLHVDHVGNGSTWECK
jgi:hypothetical protein